MTSFQITQEDFEQTLDCCKKVLTDYSTEEKVLQSVFRTYSGFNYEDIITRITLLNEFYSTSILDIRSMAKHIAGIKNIQERLEEGKPEIVQEIAILEHNSINKVTGETERKSWHHTSFASKFASFTYPDKYPIYDSMVVNVFIQLKKKKILEPEFTLASLTGPKGYAKYIEVYRKFIEVSGIDKLKIDGEKPTYKQVDKYLWYSRKIMSLFEENKISTQDEDYQYATRIKENILNRSL